MAKKEKDTKIERSEVLYYRMLVVLAALIAVIFSITYLTRTAEGYNNFLLNVAPAVALVFAVLCIPALIFFFILRKKGKDERTKVLSSGYLLSLSLWLTSIFTLYGKLSSKSVIAYIVVTAALYFVYYLFNREFFVFSLYSAIGAGILLALHSSTRAEQIISAVLALIVSLGVVLLLVKDKKKPVEIRIGKSVVKITDGKFKMYPFAVSAAVIIVGAILSFFMADAAFYSLVVLFACYLVFTIVNTVKMM